LELNETAYRAPHSVNTRSSLDLCFPIFIELRSHGKNNKDLDRRIKATILGCPVEKANGLLRFNAILVTALSVILNGLIGCVATFD
jgi:hypothetical protein